MREYVKVPTSAEVWAVIRAKHTDELQVFNTLSEPDGDPWGNSSHCTMMTEYGFHSAGVPLLGAKTTRQKHPTKEHYRMDEKTIYWLCYPVDQHNE